MAHSERLMPWIKKWEGGFSNHPADRGGATNKGITIKTFRLFYGKEATVEHLRNMTDAQWQRIFLAGYWRPWKADSIRSQSIANICVDWAWASGTVTAIRQVQRLLGVRVDGIVGEQTLAAINKRDARELFDKIREARIAFVDAIIARDPSQQVFERGWKRRINDIDFVDYA